MYCTTLGARVYINNRAHGLSLTRGYVDRQARKFCHVCTINNFTFQIQHHIFLTLRAPRFSTKGGIHHAKGLLHFSIRSVVWSEMIYRVRAQEPDNHPVYTNNINHTHAFKVL